MEQNLRKENLFVGERDKSLIPKEGRKSGAFLSPALGTGLGQGLGWYLLHHPFPGL